MNSYRRPFYRDVNEWIKDTRTLHSAYKDMKNDILLHAEIKRLELIYLKKHLISNVGKDEAERILYEHGFS